MVVTLPQNQLRVEVYMIPIQILYHLHSMGGPHVEIM